MKVKTSTEQHIKIPWHLWLIGLLFVFIYANGVYDYFMMLGHNVDYYNSKHYGEAVVAYFTNYPIVFLILYTTNIFCGLICPILLLFRIQWAMWIGFASAVSMFFLEVLTFAFRNRWDVFGPFISIFDITLLIITWGLFFYCRKLTKRGVLK
ncbi:membrane protein [Clostridium acetobutylicum EA 2018]|nr:membrane protein [Clostridium acetobutylicum EA 2018]